MLQSYISVFPEYIHPNKYLPLSIISDSQSNCRHRGCIRKLCKTHILRIRRKSCHEESEDRQRMQLEVVAEHQDPPSVLLVALVVDVALIPVRSGRLTSKSELGCMHKSIQLATVFI